MEPSSPGSVFAGDRLDDDDCEASSDFDTHITSMPRECDSTELNVTKVNRLLRPLKAKCTHLSNIGEAFLPVSDNTGPRMITTYSHRRVYRPANHQESTVPPLAVFAEPELILRRPKPVVDAGTLELSRRVYHVRDCFKRILDTLYREDELTEVTSSVRDKRRASRLQRTTSSRRDVTSPGSSAPTERIPSLRDLCSVVAGRNMKLEKPDLEWEGEETREETDTVGVDEETEIIDELYNSILPPYRRRTLVSHALTHILETDRVNRNQTLLSSLLSITLSHKPPLIPETHAIVRAMLVSALTTSRTKKNSSPPICHISHASWLDDLHCLCCAPSKREPLADISSLPAKKQTTHIPTRSLLGMFLDVLRTSSAEDATAVWLSKATHRLLHRLRKTDGPSYFYLLTGMADCVARRPGDTDNCDLRKTFAGIMQGLVQWLLAPPPSSSGPPSPDLGRRSLLRVKDDLSSPVRAAPVRRPSHLEERPVTPDDFQGLIDFLIYTSSCGLHTSVSPGLAATKDAVICLTAICVATDPVPEAGISHSDKNGLEAVLKAAKPTPSVFEYLAEGMLSGALHIPFAESLVEISPNAHIANESHQLFLAFASGLHELDLRNMGHIGYLRLEASYLYYGDVRPDNVDQLKLSFTTKNVVWKAFGWTVRHFMVFRDNYFGTFTHFSTLYEYLDKRKKGVQVGDPIELQYREGKSNMLQVQLQLGIDRGIIVAPAGLPGYERYDFDAPRGGTGGGLGSCVVLTIPTLQVQLRTHDYFMEMSLNIDLVTGSVREDWTEADSFVSVSHQHPNPMFCIDGLDIVAHRLFGPQPRTSTYVCIWEIHVGRVRALVTALEAKVLGAAGDALGLNFSDPLNAPAAEYAVPSDPDVTFLKVSVDAVTAVWLAGDCALEVRVPRGLQINHNDLAGTLHRKATAIRFPEVTLKAFKSFGSVDRCWLAATTLTFDINMDMYSRPDGWRESARAQAEFVSKQDALTGRAKVLYARGPEALVADMRRSRGSSKAGLYLPYPQVPAADNPRRRRRLGTRVKDREAIPPLSRHFSTSDGPISESESEEVISEAIRDARLAKSRPATPMTFRNFEDDGSIASGDESDDADLTEYADDSESDVYELRDEGFSDHTKVADRYDAQLISSLWHWDDSPFLLVRDRWSSVAGHRDNAPPIGAAEKSPVDCFMLREELSFGRDTTVFRITSQHGVDIRLTPLVASCVGALFSEVTLSRLSPELYIDSVISRYVRSISDTRLKGQHTVVDLCIPSARLRFMHTVPSANVSASSSRKDRGITLLDMKFQQLSLMGSIVAKFQELPFKQNLVCTIQGLSAALGVVEPRQVRSHETAHQFFPLCDIRLSSTTFRWTEVQVSISAQSSSITVEHASPSVVGASALVIVPCIQSLQRDLSRIGQQSEGVSRRLVRQILHVAEKKAMVDPLSTIQPSFLVQAGCPQQIRTSPTFKALLHLRRSLRELDTMERITFTHGHLDQQSDVRPSEWLPLLQRQVSAYAADPDSSGQTEGLRLEDLLNAASPRSSDVDGPAFSVVSLDLELGEVKTYLFNESRTSSNTFTLGAIVTSVSLRPSVISAAHASRSTKSLVAASLEHRRQDVKHLGIAFTVGNAEAYLLPHILDLAQQTIRVWRHYQAGQEHRSKRCPHPVSSEISPITPPAFVVDLTMVVDRCRIQAAAETLTFDAGASGIILISNNFIPSSRIQDTHGNSALSGNQSVIFKDIFFRARETRKASASDSLASLTFKQGRINGVIRQELDSGLTVRGVVAVEALQLSIPRSALRLYRFVEEWKADYLSGIETTMQSLLAELQGASKQALSSPSRSPAQKPAIQAHLCLGTLAIVLQMMPGTWLSWEIADVFAFAKSKSTPQTLSYSFGLQLKSQLLSISSKTNTGDSAAGTRVKFRLPVASVAGEYDGSAIQVMASIAFFDANLRPSHWDALMFIQQKFGQDFDDLVLLVQETRSKAKRPSSSSAGAHVKPVPRLKFDSLLRMKGFRFGLQGVSSTLYLECEDIYGALNNDVGDAWSLELSDLSLSFAPRGSTSMGYSASYRNSRSAFVSIDVKGAYKTLAEARSLQVFVSKIHAVMQPSSIGEVGDFVDHLQAELASKKEERALEMSKFREKTRSIMKSLEVRVSEKTSDDSSSWLDKSNLELSIKNIGVAFPLTLEQELQPPLFRRDTKAVRAFLFSVKSITFDAHRGASGSAAMKRFSFQFVERFRQAVPGDFGGENHKTQNRIVYPDVNARVRSDRRGNMRQLRVAANVSGFVLDLDSGISDYIFSLIDVYRHGKERVDRITGVGSRPAVSADMMPRLSTRPDQTHYSALPTSNILASLNFLSGQVRIHGNSGTRARKTRSVFPAIREITDESVLDSAEILDLPGLSVWAEYRATPASRKLSGSRSAEPSILMFKSTIHSSQNTLRPTLLPFVTEVIKHVEERLRKVSTSGPDTPKSSRSELSASQALESRIDEELRAVSSLNISLSLRIDQSKLELTCQPDVNVIAGLHWDSGGFIVSISPGARRVTFTGSVGGLTAGLKHGFLSDDCVRVDARNLGFSVTFGKTDNGEGKPVNSMSLVLDTEFSGAVHFSRLQDVLCFKAVWLDRIPVFGNPNFATPSTPAKGLVALPNPGTVEQGFVTALLIRIRRTTLEMDLGQSISAITMDLSNVVFRTRLTEALSEVALCIMKVDMRFAGNLSGQAAVPDFSFHTMRRREDAVAHEAESNRLLELSMSTGAFNITLESERQQLLYYHAEPLHVMIFDDWSHASSEHHWLQLSFVVSGSEVVAVVTVGTIPRLIMYANKFKANLDAQREGASRESKAFRVASTPKPDNPLSAVASAMIQSARTRLTEPESRVSYVIRQHMSLHLDLLRLTVFPRTVRDVEMAQLVGRDVQARLDRHVDPDGLTAHRDLHLEFAGISVARFHQLNTSLAMKTTSDNAKYWLDALTKDASEAIIFGLPSMKMSMDSTEAVEDRIRVLAYNFHSHFLRETDMKREDIYITLNMSLYAWLTILRKNFAREMEQVQASGDGHSTKLQATSASSLRRKAGEQSFSLDTLDAPLYKPPPGPADSSQPGRPPNVRASTFTHSRSVSHAGSFPASHNPALPSQDPIARDFANNPSKTPTVPASLASTQDKGLIFRPQNRQIERLTMRQLGEATPDVMHPFFMKKSGFNLEDSLPQYVHEYATTPLEEIMRALLQLYSKQLRVKSDLSSKT
ncbi:hypothetical protein GLOTRDRAFT_137631 [Gloeophyllum trabeum ATCC 11539]|uniref:Uncharacterized protein n=1 Tax=Gloeophyllum trabeum (strain ATCC 11539 / FP-39264 / Madison 617) TaxID=670483 RepID=S7QD47_GLOTA|nr:uncharacterized protein GLOTRDRAFT_137631 [Gloeophyllum trabeum ATCC 11539]EPQ57267.1 hypothetical protein GLOTRDRAFT_137631 [Gloeophyllum trabeum ATCC 11539]